MASWAPCFARGVAMLKLLGLEIGDIRGKFRVLVAELGQLLANNGDRFRSRPHRCRPSPPSSLISAVAAPSAKPATLQSGCSAVGRTPPLGHQPVEAIEVPLLLRRHARDLVRGAGIAPEHRQLAGIDAGRAIFAGLVDAQHRRPVGAAIAGAPAGGHALPRASAIIRHSARSARRTASPRSSSRPRSRPACRSRSAVATTSMTRSRPATCPPSSSSRRSTRPARPSCPSMGPSSTRPRSPPPGPSSRRTRARRRTSTGRCGAAGRRARAPGSRREAGRAATRIRLDRPPRPLRPARPPSPP